MRLMGERVLLREFRQEDISGMRDWINDTEITRYLGGAFTRPQTWEQTEQYLRGFLTGDAGGVNFAIAEKESGRYIGQCNLLSIDYVARNAELAITLTRQYVGDGLGTEAVRLLTGYAFRMLNLNKVYLKVHSDNKRAIRCYEKCGFVQEGVLREHKFLDGRYADILFMGILRREFAQADE